MLVVDPNDSHTGQRERTLVSLEKLGSQTPWYPLTVCLARGTSYEPGSRTLPMVRNTLIAEESQK